MEGISEQIYRVLKNKRERHYNRNLYIILYYIILVNWFLFMLNNNRLYLTQHNHMSKIQNLNINLNRQL